MGKVLSGTRGGFPYQLPLFDWWLKSRGVEMEAQIEQFGERARTVKLGRRKSPT